MIITGENRPHPKRLCARFDFLEGKPWADVSCRHVFLQPSRVSFRFSNASKITNFKMIFMSDNLGSSNIKRVPT